MRSTLKFTYTPEGDLLSFINDGDNLYQGQIGTAEYQLRMADPSETVNWRSDDTVLISFERPDGKATSQLMTWDAAGGCWYYMSNGWESDVDVGTHGSALLIGFVMRRYLLASPGQLVATKTTEQSDGVIIYPSPGYTPLGLTAEQIDAVLAQIGVINGRLDGHDVNLVGLNIRLAAAENTKQDKTDPALDGLGDNNVVQAILEAKGIAEAAAQDAEDAAEDAEAAQRAAETAAGAVADKASLAQVDAKIAEHNVNTEAHADKYVKPGTGIPSTDLAAGVQSSLGKADSAVQTESDPTVPAWAKASGKPSYTPAEIGAATAAQGAKADTSIQASEKGSPGGVVPLDANGHILAQYIPGSYGEVQNYPSLSAFPDTGAAGTIYVAEDTNIAYRWNGTGYSAISGSLALGETESTAYRGDKGKVAYDHSQASGNPHGTLIADISGLADALGDKVDKDFSALTEKDSAADTDLLVINDVAASGALKKVRVSRVRGTVITKNSTTAATFDANNQVYTQPADFGVLRANCASLLAAREYGISVESYDAEGNSVRFGAEPEGIYAKVLGEEDFEPFMAARDEDVVTKKYFDDGQLQSDWTQSDTGANDYIKNKPTIPSPYTLPTASDTVLGGVKVGSGLSIDDGVLSAEGGGGGTNINVEVLGDWS